MISNYTFFGLLKLMLDKLVTVLFYSNCRLIRRPFYVRGKAKIFFGKGLTTGVGCRFDVFSKVKKKSLIIGEGVQINDYVHLACVDSIIIEDKVLIASRVFISDHNHGSYVGNESPLIFPIDRPLVSKPVLIEEGVWIGEGVSIMPGVTIGKGSVIGAASVVTHDVDSYTVAAGVPARVIKRFDFKLGVWT